MNNTDMCLKNRSVRRNVMENNITEEVYRHKNFNPSVTYNDDSKIEKKELFLSILSIIGTILIFLFKVIFTIAKIGIGILIFIIKFILGIAAIVAFV